MNSFLCNTRSLVWKTWWNCRPGERKKERQEEEVTEESRRFTRQDVQGDFLCGGTVSFWGIATECRLVHKDCSSHSECNSVLLHHLWWGGKKRAISKTSLDQICKRVDRIASSKEQSLCHQHQVWVKSQLSLWLLLLTILQLYHPPPPLPPPVSNSSCCSPMPAPVCWLLYCATVLFKVLYYKIKNVFVCFLCIICVKIIINLLQNSTVELIVLAG